MKTKRMETMKAVVKQAMDEKKFRFLMTQVSKFNNLGTARSFAQRGSKISAILHGDHPLFWVTTPAVAKKLERAGYEIIEYVNGENRR